MYQDPQFKEIFQENIEVLRKYKVGQSLLITHRPGPGTRFWWLCSLTGFSTNCFGEFILDLNVLSKYNEAGNTETMVDVKQLNPGNKTYSIEIL